jgi:RNA polymerase sigma factor (sigma-70 family)
VTCSPTRIERPRRHEPTDDKGLPRGHLHLVSQRNGSLVNWSQLMQRAQAGDSQAYTNLLVSITPYVRALARRALADTADVDEAVQDVLLTIHQIRHTYDPKRPFAPWLATIARRRIIDHSRANARFSAHDAALIDAALVDSTAIDATRTEPKSYDALFAAIDMLPAGQRRAVELLKIRGLSLKEAAAKTGMTVSALKVATHRAYKRLRRLLTDLEPRP